MLAALGTRYPLVVEEIKASALRVGRRWMSYGQQMLLRKEYADLWIREFQTSTTLGFDRLVGKSLFLFHHWDPSVLRYKSLSRLIKNRYDQLIPRVECMVVVAEYWRERMLPLKPKRIEVIPSGFDSGPFEVDDRTVSDFRRRFGFDARPIVYIGNCRREKGVVEAYEALKGLDVNLVSSGHPEVQLGARNLDVDRESYIHLLAASSVAVLNSQFEEGWCRSAHEAMLTGTPVVGSGRGGMAELLLAGGQVQATTLDEIRSHVSAILDDATYREELSIAASRIRAKFTMERFAQKWISVVGSLIEN